MHHWTLFGQFWWSQKVWLYPQQMNISCGALLQQQTMTHSSEFYCCFSFSGSLSSLCLSVSRPLYFPSVIYLCHNTHTKCTSLMDSYRSRFSTKSFCNHAFFQKTMLIVVDVDGMLLTFFLGSGYKDSVWEVACSMKLYRLKPKICISSCITD